MSTNTNKKEKEVKLEPQRSVNYSIEVETSIWYN
jgi:hypothetical protein